jgi:hypothetical protein
MYVADEKSRTGWFWHLGGTLHHARSAQLVRPESYRFTQNDQLRTAEYDPVLSRCVLRRHGVILPPMGARCLLPCGGGFRHRDSPLTSAVVGMLYRVKLTRGERTHPGSCWKGASWWAKGY